MKAKNMLEMTCVAASVVCACGLVKSYLKSRDNNNYVRGSNDSTKAWIDAIEKYRDATVYWAIKYARSIGNEEMVKDFIRKRNENFDYIKSIREKMNEEKES